MRLLRLVGLSGSKAFLKAKSTSRFAYGLVSPGFTIQSLKDLRSFIFPPFAYMHKKAGLCLFYTVREKQFGYVEL